MTAGAGVIRDAASLAAAAGAAVEAMAGAGGDTPAHAELRSLAEVARAIATAATRREESRGAAHPFRLPRRSPDAPPPDRAGVMQTFTPEWHPDPYPAARAPLPRRPDLDRARVRPGRAERRHRAGRRRTPLAPARGRDRRRRPADLSAGGRPHRPGARDAGAPRCSTRPCCSSRSRSGGRRATTDSTASCSTSGAGSWARCARPERLLSRLLRMLTSANHREVSRSRAARPAGCTASCGSTGPARRMKPRVTVRGPDRRGDRRDRARACRITRFLLTLEAGGEVVGVLEAAERRRHRRPRDRPRRPSGRPHRPHVGGARRPATTPMPAPTWWRSHPQVVEPLRTLAVAGLLAVDTMLAPAAVPVTGAAAVCSAPVAPPSGLPTRSPAPSPRTSTPLGDLTSALLPAGARAEARFVPAPTACWPAPSAPPRRSPRSTRPSSAAGTRADGDAVDGRPGAGHRRRPAGVGPHRRAHRAQLPRATSPASPPSPGASSTPPRPTIRGLGHPQDHARACGRSRRRRCGPAAAPTTAATSPSG